MISLNYGIQNIWHLDGEKQWDFMQGIAENIRHVKDPDIIRETAQDMKNCGMFYVEDDDYMAMPEYFGHDIMNYDKGLYIGHMCKLALKLAMPLETMDGNVLGFIGYTNQDEGMKDEEYVKYLYPPKSVFEKGRFLYIRPEEYRSAIQDGYICIIDGLFDARRLNLNGIHAASLCGSVLTDWHIRYLGFIKHIIVIADNDTAGRKLVKLCKWKLRNVIEIVQGSEWDIDDFLKSKANIKRFKETFRTAKSMNFLCDSVISKTNIFE